MTDHLALRPLFLGWDCVEPFEAALKLQFGPLTHWSLLKSTMEKNPGMFSSKTLTSLRLKKERHEHLEWHGGEEIFILEVNFSFKIHLSFLELKSVRPRPDERFIMLYPTWFSFGNAVVFSKTHDISLWSGSRFFVLMWFYWDRSAVHFCMF